MAHKKQAREKANITKSIRLKLEENNATIACADKEQFYGHTTHGPI
jgi:hypothetical protein